MIQPTPQLFTSSSVETVRRKQSSTVIRSKVGSVRGATTSKDSPARLGRADSIRSGARVEGTTPPPNKEEEMTRKDYVLIADTIANLREQQRDAGPFTNNPSLAEVAEELAHALQGDNPRFDRARFLDACGVK